MCGVRLRWSRNASSLQTSADVITLNAEWYEASLMAASLFFSSVRAASESSACVLPISVEHWPCGLMIFICILATVLWSSSH